MALDCTAMSRQMFRADMVDANRNVHRDAIENQC
jgi:hypothetical protein